MVKRLKIALIKYVLRKKRKKLMKKNLIGERFIVPRVGLDGVETILYRPKTAGSGTIPVLFNVHGGGFVGGDASQLDSYCSEMAERIPAFIVNINYKKIDIHPFPYPQMELHDTVLYFSDHANDYGIDPSKFVLIGYSAGAHLCAGAAMKLKENGFSLAGQILAYPFLDFTFGRTDDVSIDKTGKVMGLIEEVLFPDLNVREALVSPVLARNEDLAGLAPATIIVCEEDELLPQAVQYAKRLEEVGVPVRFKQYPEAKHGFLEVNHPEYAAEKSIARSPEQEKIMCECKGYLIQELAKYFKDSSEREWNI
ncbi:alpha/beta hydrolase [Paenibacillus sp. E222]|uniref:alpha/beta hydrolase n=1 Tax=Paenibacillus sp. E222 TaxID=2748863 RepID=UPI0015C5E9EE|nr:alpha/beta hydrolase [Paenibacillus sp. E222]QLG40489.1 alpha/beta hydrolase [Paenibacillus sp. E222]